MTFKDIDTVHERPEGTARKRFADNRKRFIEETDYFIVTPEKLENCRMSGKRTSGIESVNPRGTALLTESGYLMLAKTLTDNLAWEVQRQLVNSYFRVRETVNTELSPELQMLQGLLNQMVQKELEDKERDRKIALAKESADKAIQTTENIKEAVRPVLDNWRSEINSKFNRIQKNASVPFSELRVNMYAELEKRAGCDLGTRLRNRQKRISEKGGTKSEINSLNKMDIIDQDKKLREIFSKIVAEYEIKYCT